MKTLHVGDTIARHDLTTLLGNQNVRLCLGGDREPLDAPAESIVQVLEAYLDLEVPGWSAFEVVVVDLPSRLCQMRVLRLGQKTAALATMLQARLRPVGNGVAELEVYTPLASSLLPVGARLHDVHAAGAAGISLFGLSEQAQVVKPWGSEHWLHQVGDAYGFKVIRITAGKRTSLQLHQAKHEIYFVLSGRALLHCRLQDGTPHTIDFPAGHAARVEPGSVHRVEAITDVVLVEASTADDGSDNIRLEDDAHRPNGRIDDEYTAPATVSAAPSSSSRS